MNNERALKCAGNSALREKIDAAKLRLPIPSLMRRLDYDEKHIGKEALCPFHLDEHPSFSVFQKKDGTWWHRCFVGCTEGDEIAFLAKARNLSKREAITLYLEMAGFPPSLCPKSREYPHSPGPPASPESPACPVSPVSNGQGLEKELKELAACNACRRVGDRAGTKRFKLARDLRGVEKRIGGELAAAELIRASDEWYDLSQTFLRSDETREHHREKFLAELTKVRVPTS